MGLAISDLDLDLAEARARVRAALYMLDHTYDPPVNEEVRPLRALIDARMHVLPDGFELPTSTPRSRPTSAKRCSQTSSPRPRAGAGVATLTPRTSPNWRSSSAPTTTTAARCAGARSWVEIFMTSWLAGKAAREPAFFTRVPDVLRDWARYAGRRRGVPAVPLSEAVAAVDHYREEMLEAVGDPDVWAPAKTFAVAALDAGVDLTDSVEVERFMQRYNDGLAA